MMNDRRASYFAKCLLVLALAVLVAPVARAHCDSLDGPVVVDARKALAAGDVTLVLKWVRTEDEAQIREAFQRTLAVRKLSAESKELADRYFFETLVRVHRQAEGAPYTGLKPTGAEVEPGIREAEEAIHSGSVAVLNRRIGEHVAAEMQRRFDDLMNKKKLADSSVAKGREFVAAYADFIHFVDNLHKLFHSGEAKSAGEGAHKH